MLNADKKLQGLKFLIEKYQCVIVSLVQSAGNRVGSVAEGGCNCIHREQDNLSGLTIHT